MRKINIGIIGFGNIGCGVVKILGSRKSLLAQKIETEIVIRKICDKDLTKKRDVAVNRALLTGNADEIISDPGIDIIVELIGGINPAKEFILAALKKGKHVVTANKALLNMVTSYLGRLAPEEKISILKLRSAQVSRL